MCAVKRFDAVAYLYVSESILMRICVGISIQSYRQSMITRMHAFPLFAHYSFDANQKCVPIDFGKMIIPQQCRCDYYYNLLVITRHTHKETHTKHVLSLSHATSQIIRAKNRHFDTSDWVWKICSFVLCLYANKNHWKRSKLLPMKISSCSY